MKWEEFDAQAEQASMEQQQQEEQNPDSKILEYIKTRLLPAIKAFFYPEEKGESKMPLVADYSIKQKIAVFERSKQLVTMAYNAEKIFEQYHKRLAGDIEPVYSSSSAYSRALAGTVDAPELEALNNTLHRTLTAAASELTGAEFMQKYLSEAKRSERQRWFLTEQEKAIMSGADSALDMVKQEVKCVLKDLAQQSVRASTPKGGVWVSWHMFLISLAVPVAIGFAGYAMGRMQRLPGEVALMICAILLTLYFAVGLVNFLNNHNP